MVEFKTSLIEDMKNEVTIVGTLGNITITSPWWHSKLIRLSLNNGREENFQLPYDGDGYNYEINEVAMAIRNSCNENLLMTQSRTLANMKILDEIRRKINLRYPFE